MFKKISLLMIVALLSMSGLSLSIAQTAAMIVNPGDLSAGFDQAQHDSLVAMGYDVTVVVQGDVGTAFTIDDANAVDLLLVSESISSSGADPLIGTTTPTMHNEAYGWDNWLATSGESITWKVADTVDIVNDTHAIPMEAGVSAGMLPFFDPGTGATADTVSSLAPGAVLIAQTAGNYALIFTIDKGAELADGSAAPARFAGFSIPADQARGDTAMTADAWALWEATIHWLTAKTAAMIVNPGDLSAGFDQVQYDRLVAMGYSVTVVPQSDVGSTFTIDDANAVDLLLVSESIGSSGADPLIGTITPTMHNEAYGWDNWHATTGEAITWVAVDTIDIFNAGHEIAVEAGVSAGDVPFFDPATGATADLVSALAPGAMLVGQVSTNDTTHYALIFTIDQGWELADGSYAPARFAGFSLPADKAFGDTALTADAWALWEATINWLTTRTLIIPIQEVTWDFENGSDEGFTLSSLVPATPAADDPNTAGDEAVTGGWEVGNANNLPEAGVAWVTGSASMMNGLLPGGDPGSARVDADGLLDYSLGKPRIGPDNIGSLNTYSLNFHGDGVHNADNDQIATSPPVVLGAKMWLSALSWGGGGALAPELEADPETQGYKTGSSGIAVFSAADSSFLASVHLGNKGTLGVDSLDLSPYAGMEVFFQVVDAFQGGWGWLAVEKIQIGSEVLKVPVLLGLVAHWPMDDGSGTEVTEIVGGMNGTMVGMDPDSAWLEEGGVRFDNTAGNYIEVDSLEANGVDFGDESFTVSLLIRYLTPPTDTDRWLTKGSQGAPYSGSRYELYHTGGSDCRWVIDNGPDNIKSQLQVPNTAFITGDWVHVVAVRDAPNDTLLFYANGVFQGGLADASGDISSPNEPLWIGNVFDSGTDPMSGDMKDLRIYNYALSQADIDALFDTYGIVPPALVAHWKFDETSGTTANDEIASSDATLVNMGDSPWVAGWDGNAIDFSNKPDTGYVEVANNATVDMDSTESFTISFLVKADPVGNTAAQNLILKGTFDSSIEGHDGKRYQFEMKDSKLRWSVDDDVVKSSLDVVVTDFYPVNEWAHVVGVRDLAQDSLYLYLNGELIGSLADGTDMDISNNRSLVIGSSFDGSGKLDGQMDDLRMYNYALNADKVAELFADYGISSIGDDESGVKPLTYKLMQNYPNPFNPTTTIQFQTPQAGHVKITVYNTLGQLVTTLVDGNMKAGIHKVTFDAADYATGVYFYRLKVNDFSKVKKMLLLK